MITANEIDGDAPFLYDSSLRSEIDDFLASCNPNETMAMSTGCPVNV